MPGYEVPVAESLTGEDVHDAEGEGAIRAGARQDDLVGDARGGRPVTVDEDNARPALSGDAQVVGQVEIRGKRIQAPENNEAAFLHLLGRRRDGRTHDRPPAAALGGSAQRALGLGGAQGVEERIVGVLLHIAHGARVGAGHDGLAAIAGDDVFPAPRDFPDGLVPGNGLELTLSFLPCAPEGGGEAQGRIDGSLVMGRFRAERAAREGMLGIAGDPDGPAVFPGDKKAAAVRTVVRAAGSDYIHKKPPYGSGLTRSSLFFM